MFQSGKTISGFRGPWGVRIEIDSSLLLLLGVILYFSLDSSLLNGALFAAMLIGSIFLHELGHAWGCLVQGVPVRRVVIGGGGGFCEHGRAADLRTQELITLMGPLVNLAIWALTGIVAWIMWQWAEANPMQVMGQFSLFFDVLFYLKMLGWLNLALFVFNMIPVQPLDGGKLLHHLMRRFLPPQPALRVTGAIGLVMSILWIPAAIWGFVTYGFVLFFIPSIRAHYRMAQGGPRGR